MYKIRIFIEVSVIILVLFSATTFVLKFAKISPVITKEFSEYLLKGYGYEKIIRK